eukprot:CAMPEP_0196658320 /NCGR_PEP_ID=MMETSP1086-20130531/29020_1 /TAXON_ID=77921 /ORGANISM="Cyanoptyche  gloeocystis , Strain SAG4.97" /LENGTH=197 /DNA_ID=CAMNT_0041991841 /DNA_START=791 /DNA_END=1384 /DNA_ORIENTATION=+
MYLDGNDHGVVGGVFIHGDGDELLEVLLDSGGSDLGERHQVRVPGNGVHVTDDDGMQPVSDEALLEVQEVQGRRIGAQPGFLHLLQQAHQCTARMRFLCDSGPGDLADLAVLVDGDVGHRQEQVVRVRRHLRGVAHCGLDAGLAHGGEAAEGGHVEAPGRFGVPVVLDLVEQWPADLVAAEAEQHYRVLPSETGGLH